VWLSALLLLFPLLLLLSSLAASAAQPLALAPTPRTITYAYDGAGRLLRVDYGQGWAASYSYDAAGNLLQYRAGTTLHVYLPVLVRKH
jgi:YD repeat-containing protein